MSSYGVVGEFLDQIRYLTNEIDERTDDEEIFDTTDEIRECVEGIFDALDPERI